MTIKILSRAYFRYHTHLRKNPISISCKRLTGNYIWEKDLTVQDLKKLEEKWKHVTLNYTRSGYACESRTNGKKYILPMFPYPSGNLHMGHVRVYTISDAFARFYHLNGYEVIHPMGWDAFGLPAENAAFEKGVNPEEWTRNNIATMKVQLQEFGCKFDWERELSTCDPAYYKWTQFIFLKLFQHGLAYKQEAEVNWDPVDQTVLANEQVDENGFAWRSGAKVEKKILSQWYLKSTVLSKELLEDLDNPSFQNWREVSAIQKSWIGELNGYIVEMKIVDGENKTPIKSIDHLSVFMTHPEYIESVAFLAVKSDNILNRKQFKNPNNPSQVLNIKAIDPISSRLIPIIVSNDLTEDEVEFSVGLPHLKENDKRLCHDLGIPLPISVSAGPDLVKREEIVTKLKELNRGGYKCSSKLKDWLISRQRYWGTPIPIIYCDSCGIVPVPEHELPVCLPDAEKVKKGDLILKNLEEWRQCSCPRCGKPAQRETDTMDTFVDSSWYYIRYLDPKNHSHLVDIEKARNFLPVDLYIGGIEHALLHLYFARFIHKFLTKIGLAVYKEPFTQLLVQGIVRGESYQVESTGKYLRKEEIDFSVSPPVEKETRLSLLIKAEKMSKSKHNGVNPKDLLDEFGIDTLRLTILSFTSPQLTLNWNTADMETYHALLWKIWKATKVYVQTRKDETFPSKAARYADEKKDNEDKTLLFETRNKITLKINHAYEETRQLHILADNIKQLINVFWSVRKHLILSDEYEKCIRCALLFLAPYCPHFTSELWQRVNEVSSFPKEQQTEYIFDARWPSVDPTYERVLVCKVNDDEICSIRIPKADYDSLTQEKVIALAYEDEEVSSLLRSSTILEVEFQHHPKYISTICFMTKSKREIAFDKRETKRQRKEAKKEKKKEKYNL